MMGGITSPYALGRVEAFCEATIKVNLVFLDPFCIDFLVIV